MIGVEAFHSLMVTAIAALKKVATATDAPEEVDLAIAALEEVVDATAAAVPEEFDEQPPASITGRDGLIMAKALALAIAVVPHLPQECQAQADREDMLLLLRTRWGAVAQVLLDQAANICMRLNEGG